MKGKALSPWGQSSSDRGCPERLRNLYPLSFSRPNWKKLWETWSDLTADPCLSRRLDWRLWRSVPTWIILRLLHSTLPYVLQTSVHTKFPEGCGVRVKCFPFLKSFWVSCCNGGTWTQELDGEAWWQSCALELAEWRAPLSFPQL